MIKKLVDELDPLTVMVLMNALCLEAEWDDPYVLIIAMYIAEDTPKAVLCLIRFKSRKWIKQLTAADSAPPVLGEDPEIEIEEAEELKNYRQ